MLWRRAGDCCGKLLEFFSAKPFLPNPFGKIAPHGTPDAMQAAVVTMAVPKPRPHLYVSHRGDSRKTTGCYGPNKAETIIRDGGGQTWLGLQERLRQTLTA